MMRLPEASAFQFVGSAKVGGRKKHLLDQYGPVDMFENFYLGEKQKYQETIADISKQRDDFKTDAVKWRTFRANPIKYLVKKLIHF
jgi:hypothetical protein